MLFKFILAVLGAVFGTIIAECGFTFGKAFRFETEISFILISLLFIFAGTAITVCSIYFGFAEPLLTMMRG